MSISHTQQIIPEAELIDKLRYPSSSYFLLSLECFDKHSIEMAPRDNDLVALAIAKDGEILFLHVSSGLQSHSRE